MKPILIAATVCLFAGSAAAQQQVAQEQKCAMRVTVPDGSHKVCVTTTLLDDPGPPNADKWVCLLKAEDFGHGGPGRPMGLGGVARSRYIGVDFVATKAICDIRKGEARASAPFIEGDQRP